MSENAIPLKLKHIIYNTSKHMQSHTYSHFSGISGSDNCLLEVSKDDFTVGLLTIETTQQLTWEKLTLN